MGFLESVTGRFKKFSEHRLEGRIEGLVKDTEKVEARFRAEVKRFGIEIDKAAPKNYYESLGIKYTNDQKLIRSSYLKLIKKYHPDVSTDPAAKERAEEVNEAYSTLRDRKLKLDYDTEFSKGTNKLGQDASRAMSEALLKKYIEIREKEFDEFRKRVAVPLQMDAIKAAIEEVLDWNKRFNRAVSLVFGNLMDCGRTVRRLNAANKSLLKGRESGIHYDKLSKNARTLAMLAQADEETGKGINAVIGNVKSRISADEAKVAEKLRGSVR